MVAYNPFKGGGSHHSGVRRRRVPAAGADPSKLSPLVASLFSPADDILRALEPRILLDASVVAAATGAAAASSSDQADNGDEVGPITSVIESQKAEKGRTDKKSKRSSPQSEPAAGQDNKERVPRSSQADEATVVTGGKVLFKDTEKDIYLAPELRSGRHIVRLPAGTFAAGDKLFEVWVPGSGATEKGTGYSVTPQGNAGADLAVFAVSERAEALIPGSAQTYHRYEVRVDATATGRIAPEPQGDRFYTLGFSDAKSVRDRTTADFHLSPIIGGFDGNEPVATIIQGPDPAADADGVVDEVAAADFDRWYRINVKGSYFAAQRNQRLLLARFTFTDADSGDAPVLPPLEYRGDLLYQQLGSEILIYFDLAKYDGDREALVSHGRVADGYVEDKAGNRITFRFEFLLPPKAPSAGRLTPSPFSVIAASRIGLAAQHAATEPSISSDFPLRFLLRGEGRVAYDEEKSEYKRVEYYYKDAKVGSQYIWVIDNPDFAGADADGTVEEVTGYDRGDFDRWYRINVRDSYFTDLNNQRIDLIKFTFVDGGRDDGPVLPPQGQWGDLLYHKAANNEITISLNLGKHDSDRSVWTTASRFADGYVADKAGNRITFRFEFRVGTPTQPAPPPFSGISGYQPAVITDTRSYPLALKSDEIAALNTFASEDDPRSPGAKKPLLDIPIFAMQAPELLRITSVGDQEVKWRIVDGRIRIWLDSGETLADGEKIKLKIQDSRADGATDDHAIFVEVVLSGPPPTITDVVKNVGQDIIIGAKLLDRPAGAPDNEYHVELDTHKAQAAGGLPGGGIPLIRATISGWGRNLKPRDLISKAQFKALGEEFRDKGFDNQDFSIGSFNMLFLNSETNLPAIKSVWLKNDAGSLLNIRFYIYAPVEVPTVKQKQDKSYETPSLPPEMPTPLTEDRSGDRALPPDAVLASKYDIKAGNTAGRYTVTTDIAALNKYANELPPYGEVTGDAKKPYILEFDLNDIAAAVQLDRLRVTTIDPAAGGLMANPAYLKVKVDLEGSKLRFRLDETAGKQTISASKNKIGFVLADPRSTDSNPYELTIIITYQDAARWTYSVPAAQPTDPRFYAVEVTDPKIQSQYEKVWDIYYDPEAPLSAAADSPLDLFKFRVSQSGSRVGGAPQYSTGNNVLISLEHHPGPAFTGMLLVRLKGEITEPMSAEISTYEFVLANVDGTPVATINGRILLKINFKPLPYDAPDRQPSVTGSRFLPLPSADDDAFNEKRWRLTNAEGQITSTYGASIIYLNLGSNRFTEDVDNPDNDQNDYFALGNFINANDDGSYRYTVILKESKTLGDGDGSQTLILKDSKTGLTVRLLIDVKGIVSLSSGVTFDDSGGRDGTSKDKAYVVVVPASVRVGEVLSIDLGDAPGYTGITAVFLTPSIVRGSSDLASFHYGSPGHNFKFTAEHGRLVLKLVTMQRPPPSGGAVEIRVVAMSESTVKVIHFTLRISSDIASVVKPAASQAGVSNADVDDNIQTVGAADGSWDPVDTIRVVSGGASIPANKVLAVVTVAGNYDLSTDGMNIVLPYTVTLLTKSELEQEGKNGDANKGFTLVLIGSNQNKSYKIKSTEEISAPMTRSLWAKDKDGTLLEIKIEVWLGAKAPQVSQDDRGEYEKPRIPSAVPAAVQTGASVGDGVTGADAIAYTVNVGSITKLHKYANELAPYADSSGDGRLPHILEFDLSKIIAAVLPVNLMVKEKNVGRGDNAHLPVKIDREGNILKIRLDESKDLNDRVVAASGRHKIEFTISDPRDDTKKLTVTFTYASPPELRYEVPADGQPTSAEFYAVEVPSVAANAVVWNIYYDSANPLSGAVDNPLDLFDIVLTKFGASNTLELTAAQNGIQVVNEMGNRYAVKLVVSTGAATREFAIVEKDAGNREVARILLRINFKPFSDIYRVTAQPDVDGSKFLPLPKADDDAPNERRWLLANGDGRYAAPAADDPDHPAPEIIYLDLKSRSFVEDSDQRDYFELITPASDASHTDGYYRYVVKLKKGRVLVEQYSIPRLVLKDSDTGVVINLFIEVASTQRPQLLDPQANTNAGVEYVPATDGGLGRIRVPGDIAQGAEIISFALGGGRSAYELRQPAAASGFSWSIEGTRLVISRDAVTASPLSFTVHGGNPVSLSVLVDSAGLDGELPALLLTITAAPAFDESKVAAPTPAREFGSGDAAVTVDHDVGVTVFTRGGIRITSTQDSIAAQKLLVIFGVKDDGPVRLLTQGELAAAGKDANGNDGFGIRIVAASPYREGGREYALYTVSGASSIDAPLSRSLWVKDADGNLLEIKLEVWLSAKVPALAAAPTVPSDADAHVSAIVGGYRILTDLAALSTSANTKTAGDLWPPVLEFDLSGISAGVPPERLNVDIETPDGDYLRVAAAIDGSGRLTIRLNEAQVIAAGGEHKIQFTLRDPRHADNADNRLTVTITFEDAPLFMRDVEKPSATQAGVSTSDVDDDIQTVGAGDGTWDPGDTIRVVSGGNSIPQNKVLAIITMAGGDGVALLNSAELGAAKKGSTSNNGFELVRIGSGSRYKLKNTVEITAPMIGSLWAKDSAGDLLEIKLEVWLSAKVPTLAAAPTVPSDADAHVSAIAGGYRVLTDLAALNAHANAKAMGDPWPPILEFDLSGSSVGIPPERLNVGIETPNGDYLRVVAAIDESGKLTIRLTEAQVIAADGKHKIRFTLTDPRDISTKLTVIVTYEEALSISYEVPADGLPVSAEFHVVEAPGSTDDMKVLDVYYDPDNPLSGTVDSPLELFDIVLRKSAGGNALDLAAAQNGIQVVNEARSRYVVKLVVSTDATTREFAVVEKGAGNAEVARILLRINFKPLPYYPPDASAQPTVAGTSAKFVERPLASDDPLNERTWQFVKADGRIAITAATPVLHLDLAGRNFREDSAKDVGDYFEVVVPAVDAAANGDGNYRYTIRVKRALSVGDGKKPLVLRDDQTGLELKLYFQVQYPPVEAGAPQVEAPVILGNGDGSESNPYAVTVPANIPAGELVFLVLSGGSNYRVNSSSLAAIGTADGRYFRFSAADGRLSLERRAGAKAILDVRGAAAISATVGGDGVSARTIHFTLQIAAAPGSRAPTIIALAMARARQGIAAADIDDDITQASDDDGDATTGNSILVVSGGNQIDANKILAVVTISDDDGVDLDGGTKILGYSLSRIGVGYRYAISLSEAITRGFSDTLTLVDKNSNRLTIKLEVRLAARAPAFAPDASPVLPSSMRDALGAGVAIGDGVTPSGSASYAVTADIAELNAYANTRTNGQLPYILEINLDDIEAGVPSDQLEVQTKVVDASAAADDAYLQVEVSRDPSDDSILRIRMLRSAAEELRTISAVGRHKIELTIRDKRGTSSDPKSLTITITYGDAPMLKYSVPGDQPVSSEFYAVEATDSTANAAVWDIYYDPDNPLSGTVDSPLELFDIILAKSAVGNTLELAAAQNGIRVVNEMGNRYAVKLVVSTGAPMSRDFMIVEKTPGNFDAARILLRVNFKPFSDIYRVTAQPDVGGAKFWPLPKADDDAPNERKWLLANGNGRYAAADDTEIIYLDMKGRGFVEDTNAAGNDPGDFLELVVPAPDAAATSGYYRYVVKLRKDKVLAESDSARVLVLKDSDTGVVIRLFIEVREEAEISDPQSADASVQIDASGSKDGSTEAKAYVITVPANVSVGDLASFALNGASSSDISPVNFAGSPDGNEPYFGFGISGDRLILKRIEGGTPVTLLRASDSLTRIISVTVGGDGALGTTFYFALRISEVPITFATDDDGAYKKPSLPDDMPRGLKADATDDDGDTTIEATNTLGQYTITTDFDNLNKYANEESPYGEVTGDGELPYILEFNLNDIKASFPSEGLDVDAITGAGYLRVELRREGGKLKIGMDENAGKGLRTISAQRNKIGFTLTDPRNGQTLDVVVTYERASKVGYSVPADSQPDDVHAREVTDPRLHKYDEKVWDVYYDPANPPDGSANALELFDIVLTLAAASNAFVLTEQNGIQVTLEQGSGDRYAVKLAADTTGATTREFTIIERSSASDEVARTTLKINLKPLPYAAASQPDVDGAKFVEQPRAGGDSLNEKRWYLTNAEGRIVTVADTPIILLDLGGGGFGEDMSDPNSDQGDYFVLDGSPTDNGNGSYRYTVKLRGGVTLGESDGTRTLILKDGESGLRIRLLILVRQADVPDTVPSVKAVAKPVEQDGVDADEIDSGITKVQGIRSDPSGDIDTIVVTSEGSSIVPGKVLAILSIEDDTTVKIGSVRASLPSHFGLEKLPGTADKYKLYVSTPHTPGASGIFVGIAGEMTIEDGTGKQLVVKFEVRLAGLGIAVARDGPSSYWAPLPPISVLEEFEGGGRHLVGGDRSVPGQHRITTDITEFNKYANELAPYADSSGDGKLRYILEFDLRHIFAGVAPEKLEVIPLDPDDDARSDYLKVKVDRGDVPPILRIRLDGADANLRTISAQRNKIGFIIRDSLSDPDNPKSFTFTIVYEQFAAEVIDEFAAPNEPPFIASVASPTARGEIKSSQVDPDVVAEGEYEGSRVDTVVVASASASIAAGKIIAVLKIDDEREETHPVLLDSVSVSPSVVLVLERLSGTTDRYILYSSNEITEDITGEIVVRDRDRVDDPTSKKSTVKLEIRLTPVVEPTVDPPVVEPPVVDPPVVEPPVVEPKIPNEAPLIKDVEAATVRTGIEAAQVDSKIGVEGTYKASGGVDTVVVSSEGASIAAGKIIAVLTITDEREETHPVLLDAVSVTPSVVLVLARLSGTTDKYILYSSGEITEDIDGEIVVKDQGGVDDSTIKKSTVKLEIRLTPVVEPPVVDPPVVEPPVVDPPVVEPPVVDPPVVEPPVVEPKIPNEAPLIKDVEAATVRTGIEAAQVDPDVVAEGEYVGSRVDTVVVSSEGASIAAGKIIAVLTITDEREKTHPVLLDSVSVSPSVVLVLARLSGTTDRYILYSSGEITEDIDGKIVVKDQGGVDDSTIKKSTVKLEIRLTPVVEPPVVDPPVVEPPVVEPPVVQPKIPNEAPLIKDVEAATVRTGIEAAQVDSKIGVEGTYKASGGVDTVVVSSEGASIAAGKIIAVLTITDEREETHPVLLDAVSVTPSVVLVLARLSGTTDRYILYSSGEITEDIDGEIVVKDQGGVDDPTIKKSKVKLEISLTPVVEPTVDPPVVEPPVVEPKIPNEAPLIKDVEAATVRTGIEAAQVDSKIGVEGTYKASGGVDTVVVSSEGASIAAGKIIAVLTITDEREETHPVLLDAVSVTPSVVLVLARLSGTTDRYILYSSNEITEDIDGEIVVKDQGGVDDSTVKKSTVKLEISLTPVVEPKIPNEAPLIKDVEAATVRTGIEAAQVDSKIGVEGTYKASGGVDTVVVSSEGASIAAGKIIAVLTITDEREETHPVLLDAVSVTPSVVLVLARLSGTTDRYILYSSGEITEDIVGEIVVKDQGGVDDPTIKKSTVKLEISLTPVVEPTVDPPVVEPPVVEPKIPNEAPLIKDVEAATVRTGIEAAQVDSKIGVEGTYKASGGVDTVVVSSEGASIAAGKIIAVLTITDEREETHPVLLDAVSVTPSVVLVLARLSGTTDKYILYSSGEITEDIDGEIVVKDQGGVDDPTIKKSTVKLEISLTPAVEHGVDIGGGPLVRPVDPGVEPVDPEEPGVEPVDPEEPGVEPVDPEEPGVEPVDPGVEPGVEPVDPSLEIGNPGERPNEPLAENPDNAIFTAVWHPPEAVVGDVLPPAADPAEEVALPLGTAATAPEMSSPCASPPPGIAAEDVLNPRVVAEDDAAFTVGFASSHAILSVDSEDLPAGVVFDPAAVQFRVDKVVYEGEPAVVAVRVRCSEDDDDEFAAGGAVWRSLRIDLAPLMERARAITGGSDGIGKPLKAPAREDANGRASGRDANGRNANGDGVFTNGNGSGDGNGDGNGDGTGDGDGNGNGVSPTGAPTGDATGWRGFTAQLERANEDFGRELDTLMAQLRKLGSGHFWG